MTTDAVPSPREVQLLRAARRALDTLRYLRDTADHDHYAAYVWSEGGRGYETCAALEKAIERR